MAVVAGTNIPLLEYEMQIGVKKFMIVDHYGPKPYNNIGTASKSGDVILAADIGWGGFDKTSPLFAGYAFSGNYFVKVFTQTVTTTPSIGIGAGSSYSKFILQWFSATAYGTVGSEVADGTDLSAEIVRLELIGE